MCLAGGPGRSAAYLEALGGLDADRTLVFVDARGTGDSSDATTDDGWRVEEVAADLPAVWEALGEDRLDVLAHSAGCSIALLHAATHPEAIGRLAIVTPSPRGLPEGISDADTVRAARSGEPHIDAALDALAQLQNSPDPAAIPALMAAFNPLVYGQWTPRAEAHAAAEADEVNSAARAGFYQSGFDLASRLPSLGQLDGPTLVVTAARDGATGEAVGEFLAEHLPHSEHRTLHGCGHFPWVDEPELFRSTIASFLASE